MVCWSLCFDCLPLSDYTDHARTITRSSSQRRYAPAGARQYFRVNSEKLPVRESKLCSPLSQSWLLPEPSIQPSNRTMYASCTSPSMSCISSSLPTANRISFKTLTAFTCLLKLPPAFAGAWTRKKSCAMPSNCSVRSTNW